MSRVLTSQVGADGSIRELDEVEEAFNQAMISNDVARIRACIVDDWVLVTPETGVVPCDRLLHAIETGELSHDSMTKDIVRVRVYGDTAVVTSRGRNTGMFQGAPISADEWVTDVYLKVGGRWRCTLTHLTPVTGRQPTASGAEGRSVTYDSRARGTTMTGDDFREIALNLDGVTEKAHMNHPDFRLNGRIFASLLSNETRAGLKLSPGEQRELVRRHPTAFAPANGAWGRQGWTIVDLAFAETAVVRSALLLAYEGVGATTEARRPRRSRAARNRRMSGRG